MDIQVRHGHHIEGSARLISHVEGRITDEFSRSSDKITHAEVHFKDENAHKGGDDDIHCVLEIRVAGMKPLAVNAYAGNLDQSLEHAIDKMHKLLEHSFAKAGKSGVVRGRDKSVKAQLIDEMLDEQQELEARGVDNAEQIVR
jgi:hypothetical protein